MFYVDSYIFNSEEYFGIKNELKKEWQVFLFHTIVATVQYKKLLLELISFKMTVKQVHWFIYTKATYNNITNYHWNQINRFLVHIEIQQLISLVLVDQVNCSLYMVHMQSRFTKNYQTKFAIELIPVTKLLPTCLWSRGLGFASWSGQRCWVCLHNLLTRSVKMVPVVT